MGGISVAQSPDHSSQVQLTYHSNETINKQIQFTSLTALVPFKELIPIDVAS